MIQEQIRLFLVYLYKKHPFYNSIFSKINIFIDSSNESKKFKIYSPEFKTIVIDSEYGENLAQNKPKKLFTLLLHEVLHMLLNHPSRKGGKRSEVWDFACDLSVENVIKSDPILKGMLDFTAPSNDFTIKHSAEDIYVSVEGLFPEFDEDGEDSDMAVGQSGEGEGEGKAYTNMLSNCNLDNHDAWGSACDNDSVEEQICNMLLDASEFAKESNYGGVPGAFVELIEGFIEPKTSLKEYINTVIQDFVDFSYTYKRGDRRYLYNGLIVPSAIEDIKHFKLLFYIDTSGSMSLDGLKKSVSEIYDMVSTLESFEITVIQSDAGIKDVKTITPDSEQEEIDSLFEIHGRGGTELTPLFDFLAEQEEEFELVIVNTDFYIYEREKDMFIEMQSEKRLIALVPDNHGDIEGIDTVFHLD